MSRVKDITGQRFGKLVVLERAGSDKDGKALWLCQCDCGNTCICMGISLRNGGRTSCGCGNRERTIKRNTKHGLSNTRIYRVWKNMIQRCTNEHHPKYNYYGGRGITICDSWRKDFFAFYEWSMKNGYAEDKSIDRINNDGPYSPENCRWTNASVQARNTRKGRKFFDFGGLSDAAEKMGINRSTLKSRLYSGWSDDEALGLKPREKKFVPSGSYRYKEVPVYKLAKELGVRPANVNKRIRAGWSVERALEVPEGYFESDGKYLIEKYSTVV